MTISYPYSLADLIMAWIKLSPSDDKAKQLIFETLGIPLEPSEELFESTEDEDQKQLQKKPDFSPPKVEKPPIKESNSNTTPSDIPPKLGKSGIPSNLKLLEKSNVNIPSWFKNLMPLENGLGLSDSFTSNSLKTLFESNLTRAILVSALATYNNFGSINIEEIINFISKNEPLREIPRYPLPTMVQGVQVLIDKNESMEPFYKDQTNLVNAIKSVVGSNKTQIMEFKGCPLWGVKYTTGYDWLNYDPPTRRTVILLITDLGILQKPFMTAKARVIDWLRFIAIVKKAGCSLVSLVPYPSERWPNELNRYMKIVQWDRKTSTFINQQNFEFKIKNEEEYKMMDDPSLLIKEFEYDHPNALLLAKVVSLAVKVEPELLRTARLTLIPEANAGDEADLWFSPLVQTRNKLGFVFKPDIVKILRGELAKNEKLLNDAWYKVIEQVHRSISPFLFAEEEITWRALKDSKDPEIKRILLKTLVSIVNSENKEDVSHWILRALTNFPESIPKQITGILKKGALLCLGDANYLLSNDESISSEPMPDWILQLISSNLETIRIGVRFVEDGIEFGDLKTLDGANELELPETNPLVIDASWVEKSGKKLNEIIWLKQNEKKLLTVEVNEVELRTLSGSLYKLNKNIFFDRSEPNKLEDEDWNLLLERIKDGNCTPFLGAGVTAGKIPFGSQIANEWAKKYDYPMEDSDDLIHVAQFVAVTKDRLTPKEEMCDKIKEQLKKVTPKYFETPDEPHGVLADLPLPVYITTNYDDLMERALKSRGKTPIQEHCRWNKIIKRSKRKSPDFDPTPEKPLVFHLYGTYEVPESLVLTEDDYLDFLVAISRDLNLLPLRIQEAFANTSLLFLGYRIADWDFLLFYRILAEYTEISNRRKHLSVQLMPGNVSETRKEKAQHYLDRYFKDLSIQVYWQGCHKFASELKKRWEAFNSDT